MALAVKAMKMENSADQMQVDLLAKTGMLIEALPFMRRYSGKTILIKFGGHAMGKADYVNAFAADIALLDQVGARPVVVHGGGPQIGEMLGKLEIESNFIDGLRVTDEATVSVFEMVLAGGISGTALGSLAGIVLDACFSAEQMVRWAWRLPFLSGCLSIQGSSRLADHA